MHILLLLVVVWFVWSVIAALIRQNRRSNMVLTIQHNKRELDVLIESLTVSLGEAADRYDRIDILTARMPRYFSLVTGQPVQHFEQWVEKNPQKIEMIEKTMHDDRNYLRDAMAEMDKFFAR